MWWCSGLTHTHFVKRIVGLRATHSDANGRLFINGVAAPQRRTEDWVEPWTIPLCHVRSMQKLFLGPHLRVLDRMQDGHSITRKLDRAFRQLFCPGRQSRQQR